MTVLHLTIQPEREVDAAAVLQLEERAFGPGRFARTAYRLREFAAFDPALSFVARVETLVVGSVRLTPIRAGELPALLLGPLTVEPAFMNRGIGRALIERALSAAEAAGHGLVLLVGDEPYYARVGFQRVPRGRLSLPGPVDETRLLYRELRPNALDAANGPVTAVPVTA